MELDKYKINFATLQSIDPKAEALLEEASQVALYTLIENEWENSELEGPLFIYRRSEEPYYNILIMNTKTFKDVIEPVTEGFSFQLQVPFILFENSQNSLNGLWFHRKEDCIKISCVLTNIIKLDSIEKNVIRDSGKLNFSSAAIKVKDELNSKNLHLEQSGTVGFNLKKTKSKRKSVLNFLLEVTNQPKLNQESEEISTVGNSTKNWKNCSNSVVSQKFVVPIPVAPTKNDVKKALQHVIGIPNTCRNAKNSKDWKKEAEVQQSQISGFSAYRKQNHNRSDYLNSKTEHSSSMNNFANKSDSSQRQRKNDDVQFSDIKNSYPTIKYDSPLVKDREFEPCAVNSENRSLSLTIKINLKQPLMPPGVFETSEILQGFGKTPNLSVQKQCPHPLTKNQIVKAINYLLSYDDVFVKKMHEAYLKSLS